MLCWMMLVMTARWTTWAHVAGMARRTFMRAFSAQAGMSFGRWRQQARLFAALEMLAQNKSVTEVAIQKHTQSSSKAPIPAYLLGILAMAERGGFEPAVQVLARTTV